MTSPRSRDDALAAPKDVWERRGEDNVEVALNGWPTIITIADHADLARSTVHSAFCELEETGTVVVSSSRMPKRTGTLNTAAPASAVNTDEDDDSPRQRRWVA